MDARGRGFRFLRTAAKCTPHAPREVVMAGRPHAEREEYDSNRVAARMLAAPVVQAEELAVRLLQNTASENAAYVPFH